MRKKLKKIKPWKEEVIRVYPEHPDDLPMWDDDKAMNSIGSFTAEDVATRELLKRIKIDSLKPDRLKRWGIG